MASRILVPSLRRPMLPPFSISPCSSSSASSSFSVSSSSSSSPLSISPRRTASLRPFSSRSRRILAGTLTGLVAAHLVYTPSRQSIRLDGFGSTTIGDNIGGGIREYAAKAKNPVVSSKGKINPAVFRQVSTGSILGLTTGALVSLFSTPLAVLLGLAAVGLHLLDRKGIHLLPYSRIQAYFGNMDVKTAMVDNVAFKLSFGLTCALAGFASF